MADELQDNENPNEDAIDTVVDIETKIHTTMLSRVSHFKEQADSLTFEGVRRLLEKDLSLEPYALDVHKRYIKQCLVKCLEGAEDDNTSKDSEETAGKSVSREEAAESLGEHQFKKGVKETGLEDEEKMEDSPVMGLLTGHKTAKVESEGIKDNDDKEVPSESTIKKAIRNRIPYFKANSEKVTMAGVRRLLEDDLKLTKYALDSCKKFISQQVEEILNSCEAAERGSDLKATKKVSKESSHSTDNNNSDEESNEVKPGKKNARGRTPNSNETKKRKRPAKETVSAKKQSKHVQEKSEDNSDEENGEDASEDGHSRSSNEKPIKKEVSTPVYGKRVEHLKSVIKSCGMSVPPVVYKKIKQAPENKRESQLIKELEGILSREGLSANPSEKDIKEVKRRKERAKELEGIDVSNIVSSSRRRSTASFVPLPPAKPKIPVEADADDVEDTDEEGEEEEDEEEDAGEDDAEDNGDVDESQSEEFNEDGNEDSD